MAEPLHGFTFTIEGPELVEMCKQRIDHCEERIERLNLAAERVKNMDPEDRKVAGLKVRGGDMAEEVKSNLERVVQEKLYFQFAVEHLDPNRTYLLSSSEIERFGIKQPRGY